MLADVQVGTRNRIEVRDFTLAHEHFKEKSPCSRMPLLLKHGSTDLETSCGAMHDLDVSFA